MFEESARLVAWLVPIILLAVIFLPQMIRILREYERGVIFRLGKLLGTKGPGLIFLIPIVDRMVRMDLRVVTIDVARQEVMTRDNVPMTVDAVVYFRVIDPAAAVVRVENYLKATSLISQTTLRSVLGQAELDELLSQRDKINLRLQEIIDRQTEPWGIKVTAVEVRDVVLPDSIKRAMAGQAESERERRAKIINAEAEFQAAQKLVQAASMISAQPIALQLRFLQTMKEISSEHKTTTILPIPINLFAPFTKRSESPTPNRSRHIESEIPTRPQALRHLPRRRSLRGYVLDHHPTDAKAIDKAFREYKDAEQALHKAFLYRRPIEEIGSDIRTFQEKDASSLTAPVERREIHGY